MTQDRKDLKIQALLESLSKDKTKHESEIADLRVELTMVSMELETLREALAQKEAESDVAEETTSADSSD